jgi:hypothetical protein
VRLKASTVTAATTAARNESGLMGSLQVGDTELPEREVRSRAPERGFRDGVEECGENLLQSARRGKGIAEALSAGGARKRTSRGLDRAEV